MKHKLDKTVENAEFREYVIAEGIKSRRISEWRRNKKICSLRMICVEEEKTYISKLVKISLIIIIFLIINYIISKWWLR